MKGKAIVLLAALAGACTPAGPGNDANLANAAVGNAAHLAAATECPEEDLSCGRQRPVVSDGVHPFADLNHYLTVFFPRGSQVCLTRSGAAPHGFFAVYGAPAGCSERPERPSRFISIYAEFNALFWTSLSQAKTDDCRPLSAPMQRRLGRKPLRLPDFPSAICERQSGPGNVELTVYALAGPWQTEGAGSRTYRYRAAVYYVTFATADAHFDEDLARFRDVLESIRIDAA